MVLDIDLEKQWVTLLPLNSPHLNTIDVTIGKGLKFMSSYAPFLSNVNAKTGKVNNVPVGVVNYPQRGDRVLALVWLTDSAREDRLHTLIGQNPMMEVIILGRISWDHPLIGPYDHIIGDQSGAKLHFNHGWLDDVNVADTLPEYLEAGEVAKPHQLRTGHVTLVGNRLVSLSGKKFLPFGLFSHLLGQANDSNPMVFPEVTDDGKGGKTSRGTSWGDVFTQDPTKDIFDELLDKGGIGNALFLQPPCPEPGSMMHMHDSGYKLLVGVDGHMRTYIPKGAIFIIGQDGSMTEKKMSFDPEGQSESDTYGDVAEGVLEFHLVSGGKTLTIKFDPTSDLVELTTDGKMLITGDFEVTGKGDFGTG